MRVEIYLSSEQAKAQFDLLKKHQQTIEDLFPGETVEWERLEDAVAARVAVYRSIDKVAIGDATPEREALFAWVAENLAACRTVAKRYLVDGRAA
jgi:hypothetical protein